MMEIHFDLNNTMISGSELTAKHNVNTYVDVVLV